MNRIKGIVFHNLTGIAGWSSLSHSKIDVAKVIEITYSKRSYCIFNRQYKYTIQITYDEPTQYLSYVMGGKGVYYKTDLTQVITKRYKTELDCKIEIDTILNLQKKIDLYMTKMNQDVSTIIT